MVTDTRFIQSFINGLRTLSNITSLALYRYRIADQEKLQDSLGHELTGKQLENRYTIFLREFLLGLGQAMPKLQRVNGMEFYANKRFIYECILEAGDQFYLDVSCRMDG